MMHGPMNIKIQFPLFMISVIR